MSNSVIAAIVTPIVVAIALAFWILLVYRADRNPGSGGHPEACDRTVPQRDVAGGAFRGGGRQVMPRRDAIPAEAAGDPAQKGMDPEDAQDEQATAWREGAQPPSDPPFTEHREPEASPAGRRRAGRPDTPAGL